MMDWLAMLARGVHVVTAIAWIGASFYFVWLDNHLEKPSEKDLQDKGVDGALWAVHGGGFYHPQKYLTAPANLPKKLHWFYWESYSTWISGFVLFSLVYLYNADAFLVDQRIFDMSTSTAMGCAIAIMILGFVLYDTLCQLLRSKPKLLWSLISLLVMSIAVTTCHIFPGRAAFLVTGATLATIMSANVLFRIIPGQRKVVESLREGRAVNPLYGKIGKMRSVHNTYFTLPVVFCMLSNHFTFVSMAEYNWLVLILIMISAASLRHFFVSLHFSRVSKLSLGISIAALIPVFFLMLPQKSASTLPVGEVKSHQVYALIKTRCYGCHALEPTLVGLTPKGVAFESMQDVDLYSQSIYAQVVRSKVMPLGNVTGMTEQERQLIAAWYEGKLNAHDKKE